MTSLCPSEDFLLEEIEDAEVPQGRLTYDVRLVYRSGNGNHDGE